MKKKTIYCISFFVASVAIVFGLIVTMGAFMSGAAFNPRINSRQMERIFMEDYELLSIVTQFLKSPTHEGSSVTRDSLERGEMFTATGYRIKILDDEILSVLKDLLNRGYSNIGTEGNTIWFLRWSMLDHGRGIARTIDGSDPNLFFLTHFEPLSKPGWFYYEENFNEWRRQNSN